MSTHQKVNNTKSMDAGKQPAPNHTPVTYQSLPAVILQRAKSDPGSLAPVDVLQLQRTIGNQAVGRLLSGLGKLGPTDAAVQRKEPEGELLQRETIQNRQNTTGMPDEIKTKMERAFNTDFSGIKIHSNSQKAPEVGALAYTQGSEVHFAPGQFDPYTSRGEQLIGHELTHVVQQRAGRVIPTRQVAGVPLNDDPSLELEADMMGAKTALMPENSVRSEPDKTLQKWNINKISHNSNNVVIQGVLTRSMTQGIEYCQNEEQLVAWMHDNTYKIKDSKMAFDVAWYWLSLKGNPSMSTAEEIVKATEMFIGVSPQLEQAEEEYIAEDVAEEALNETWHIEAPGASEEVATSEDLEEGYKTKAPLAMTQMKSVQLKRKGNTLTGPKSYQTVRSGYFKKVAYKTSNKGGIDFGVPDSYSQWALPVDNATKVDLIEGVNQSKNPGKGLTKGGTKLNIKTATREQHFSIADRIMADRGTPVNRAGTWTWHHMENPYEMVLVDMTVHAKHGHNGGFLLW